MATMLGTLLLLAASVGLGSAETVMMFGGINNFGGVVSSIGSVRRAYPGDRAI